MILLFHCLNILDTMIPTSNTSREREVPKERTVYIVCQNPQFIPPPKPFQYTLNVLHQGDITSHGSCDYFCIYVWIILTCSNLVQLLLGIGKPSGYWYSYARWTPFCCRKRRRFRLDGPLWSLRLQPWPVRGTELGQEVPIVLQCDCKTVRQEVLNKTPIQSTKHRFPPEKLTKVWLQSLVRCSSLHHLAQFSTGPATG